MSEFPETQVARDPGGEAVRQFTIWADNKVGRLNELLAYFADRDLHVMAITTVDTTDSTLVRLVADYPEEVAQMLDEHNFCYSTVEIVAVEIPSSDYLYRVTCALVQAEINIHYIYPFVARPGGKTALVL
ncbi:MAG: hypothetical protein MI861_28315, partial [Pirellulales bacterium]|nr:hypothetical protein [Pirellulales bacterium]